MTQFLRIRTLEELRALSARTFVIVVFEGWCERWHYTNWGDDFRFDVFKNDQGVPGKTVSFKGDKMHAKLSTVHGYRPLVCEVYQVKFDSVEEKTP